MTRHLLIVDGDNLAHRLYHAVHDRPAHEAFGFALQRYLKDIRPTHAVVVFDPLDGYSWRREIWPAYKSGRKREPEIVKHIERCRAETQANFYARALDDDLEADDLIGAYVEAAVHEGMDATIISTDKDLTQLVRSDTRHVVMRDELKHINWWPDMVRERLGVDPERVPDLLALAGDRSDGYPGVPKIGAKTARALLQAHGSLDGVLDWARRSAEYPPSASAVARALVEHEQLARMCLRLATLRTDVALHVLLTGCKVSR